MWYFLSEAQMIDFGLLPEEFRKEFFEKNFLLKRSAYFSKNITWEDVNHALYIGESSQLGIKVYKNGFVPEAQYSTKCIEIGIIKRKIIKHALHNLLADGATIIYNRMESVSYSVRNICNVISRFIGEEVIANGYIAFGEKESFGNHWDTHDVFVVQLIGRKRWKIFESTFPLPLKNQTSKFHKHECPTIPIFDEILEAGDILYIPRGWWHTAIPLMEETFHIAVGVHPSTVIDYIKWIVHNVLPEIEECRNSLNFLGGNEGKITKATEKMAIALLNKNYYYSFQEQLIGDERFASGFDISRHFNKAEENSLTGAEISFNSKRHFVRKNTFISINGNQLNFDEKYFKIIQKISKATSPIQYGEIEKEFSDFEKNEVEKIIRKLAFCDFIEIH